MEAQRIGIEMTIIAAMDPGVRDTSQSMIAGNMAPHRLMSLVGEMPPDKEIDVCPLTLPALKMSFDQLCMDRAALRKVNFEDNLMIIESY